MAIVTSTYEASIMPCHFLMLLFFLYLYTHVLCKNYNKKYLPMYCSCLKCSCDHEQCKGEKEYYTKNIQGRNRSRERNDLKRSMLHDYNNY